MELRHLRYFLAIVDEGGFTRAAEALHVAQPGVSTQIRQLEKELGHELFDRTSRTVALTPVGESVLPYARAALAAVDGLECAVQELTGLVRGRVRVGTIGLPRVLDVPTLLAAFHTEHPGIEIGLVEAGAEDVIGELHRGELDLAIAAVVGELPAGLAAEVILRQDVVAALRVEDPLARRKSVRLKELSGRPLIAMRRGTGVRRLVDEAHEAEGLGRPRVAFEGSDPLFLARLAALGLGVALIPESAAAYEKNLVTVPLATPVHGEVGVVWRAEGAVSPAARAFTAHARRFFAELGLASPRP
ncbi:LysR family transcriptional regulator [Actinorhabdospora filicis]|uniref:LysR family transcriptional regulator n=1 Tax=Actinorhabdospora filicis TaxID=1785913 RepID=A0A9W6SUB3_9ACTN|nr:LysR family transcriptional regulator [Actinorhabdospora filicis]GLZ82080.1 LysR family transcriptional regulator [Actinorhabdospora filicis]